MPNRSIRKLDELFEREIDRGTFPGAVVLVRNEKETLAHRAFGLKSELPAEEEMREDTIFDLASLTKVIVTTSLALKLLEDGYWRLDDPVNEHLPEFDNRKVSLRQLLTHTSGLIPWADLFSGSQSRAEALDKLFTDKWPHLDPVVPPGERVIYSDLNFIILGLAIENVTGEELDDLARNRIFRPLDMYDTCFNPPDDLKERIAPTEKKGSGKAVIQGVVHDENCRSLGGVSGHAGLFSTAEDLGRFAGLLLNNGELAGKRTIGRKTLELTQKHHTEGLNEKRGLGWELQGERAESAGDLLSESSFGHTGFTGGSIWVDPENKVATVILANRVHPDRNRGRQEIGGFRARAHNLVLNELGS
ncbi:MAG: serine hydrolase domain-containing protein [Candidatus Acetothermia bacterium]